MRFVEEKISERIKQRPPDTLKSSTIGDYKTIPLSFLISLK